MNVFWVLGEVLYYVPCGKYGALACIAYSIAESLAVWSVSCVAIIWLFGFGLQFMVYILCSR